MKPLTDTKVQRGVELKEWIGSESHQTVEGLTAFAQRQEQRRREAQAKARNNIKPIGAAKCKRQA